MECEEIRVDMRLMSPEERAFGVKMAQLIYQLNHTMPMTDIMMTKTAKTR